MEKVKININGLEVEVPAGTTVLNAAELAGIHIPRLCYEQDLSPYGACRLCVVEIKGMRNLPASCVTIAAPGMVVDTHSPAVLEARRTILELMLADHPLDCLTCEKMGNCDLSRYCYEYGVKKTVFSGEQHDYPVEDTNPFIVRDMNKCILCGKCVRACAEITGKYNPDYAYRGFDIKPTTFHDVIKSDCVFCGNCVSVCPTGALSEKSIMGKARHYEFKKVKTTCPFCGTGCNFDLNVKDGKVMAVTTGRDNTVNGRALCIKGRFGWDFIYSKRRLTTPLVKRNGSFEPASWDEALDLIAGRLHKIKSAYGANSFAALSSARCTNEENYLLQKFVRAVMGTNNIDCCART
jgi:formate dehydrogenase alpha subunit